MFKCKLTGNLGKPVKAHIIPKAFYELPPQRIGAATVATNTPGVPLKKARTGIYDDGILTREGEDYFQEWDSYAADLLLRQRSKLLRRMQGAKALYWHRSDFYYDKLKLFALSVLWRAGVSRRSEFKSVDLGSHEQSLREHILSNDPGKADRYSVFLVRWTDARWPIILNPSIERLGGVNFYRVYCGQYVLHIKVDKRDTPEEFEGVQLACNTPLIIIGRSYNTSKERTLMAQIARIHYGAKR